MSVLLAWCVLSLPAGLVLGRFIARGIESTNLRAWTEALLGGACAGFVVGIAFGFAVCAAWLG
ncbi:MAG: hypothetical protein ACOYLX_12240 [Burkholderiaceae bacterium]